MYEIKIRKVLIMQWTKGCREFELIHWCSMASEISKPQAILTLINLFPMLHDYINNKVFLRHSSGLCTLNMYSRAPSLSHLSLSLEFDIFDIMIPLLTRFQGMFGKRNLLKILLKNLFFQNQNTRFSTSPPARGPGRATLPGGRLLSSQSRGHRETLYTPYII